MCSGQTGVFTKNANAKPAKIHGAHEPTRCTPAAPDDVGRTVDDAERGGRKQQRQAAGEVVDEVAPRRRRDVRPSRAARRRPAAASDPRTARTTSRSRARNTPSIAPSSKSSSAMNRACARHVGRQNRARTCRARAGARARTKSASRRSGTRTSNGRESQRNAPLLRRAATSSMTNVARATSAPTAFEIRRSSARQREQTQARRSIGRRIVASDEHLVRYLRRRSRSRR